MNHSLFARASLVPALLTLALAACSSDSGGGGTAGGNSGSTNEPKVGKFCTDNDDCASGLECRSSAISDTAGCTQGTKRCTRVCGGSKECQSFDDDARCAPNCNNPESLCTLVTNAGAADTFCTTDLPCDAGLVCQPFAQGDGSSCYPSTFGRCRAEKVKDPCQQ